jgi:CheY-like chemotaxis protein
VASAGLDPRDVRLIEIVFQHSQYNPYDFQMLEELNLTRADILIANPSDPAGLDALTAVGSLTRRIPSVSAVPRGAQATARYSITIDRLTLQLLPILNRVVEAEMLEPAVATAMQPLCDELTEVHADGAGEEAAVGAPRQAQALAAIPKTAPGMTTAFANEAAANAIAQAANRAAADPQNPISTDATAARMAAALPGAEKEPHESGPPPGGPWIGPVAQAPRRARLQALIADPSAAAQQQLARALRRIGLEVQCVVSAAAALQCLDAQHIDLVITESGLTDTDGFDLIRRMRSQRAYRYTPVLLLRSRLHMLDATRARLAGEVVVLTKPLTRNELETIVRQTLRNSVILDDLNELLSPA